MTSKESVLRFPPPSVETEPDHGRHPDAPAMRNDFLTPSVFRPENMLREIRRQKGLSDEPVSPVCILDPDGDIVGYARIALGARRSRAWACYHTEMWEWSDDGARYAVIGSAVGASFAVLVAEQLFASGCRLLFSIASAGQISHAALPEHILIERAIRDEGTSFHYLPPSQFAHADPGLLKLADEALQSAGFTYGKGVSWTTDAPFRETETAIAKHRAAGALAVEMEAAALYAFGRACKRPVLCLAHVTNQLGRIEGDFEKGEHAGAERSLAFIRAVALQWTASNVTPDRAVAGTHAP